MRTQISGPQNFQYVKSGARPRTCSQMMLVLLVQGHPTAATLEKVNFPYLQKEGAEFNNNNNTLIFHLG